MNRPILLIEDDKVDAMTVERSFNEMHCDNPLVTISNGEDALAYLKDRMHTPPCIILLDLNMPKMSGLEFLREVKRNDELRKIPVIVITTSKDERDRNECFRLSASGYMTKPVDYKEFREMIRTIYTYWSLCNIL